MISWGRRILSAEVAVTVPDRMLRLHRQLDLLPIDTLDAPITVIGAGAVGSFTTLTLAKMGCTNLTVFDDDVIDAHNLPNQFYRLDDLGRPKVEALAELVHASEGVELRAVPRRFEGARLSGIVVGAVDSMASRRLIWDAVYFNPDVRLLVDARMGGLVSIVRPVHPLRPSEARAYERTLHSDDDAMPEPCSARAILFTVLAIASTVARLVRMELVGKELPREITQDHELGLLITS